MSRHLDNYDTAKKICEEKLGCAIISFCPDWRIVRKNINDGSLYTIPDWLMGKLAQLFNYKWREV